MSIYTVQRGDSLSKIAQKLRIPGGWQSLYNWNKNIIGSNPNRIYSGTVLNTSAPAPASAPAPKAATVAAAPPSTTIGTESAKAGDARESFTDKYGALETLMPTASFYQMAAEQLNPEALRNAARGVMNFDRSLGRSGAWRSGEGMSQRQAYIDGLERARKEQLDQWVAPQQDAFARWYASQAEQYGTSKNPQAWQLKEFGVDVPGVGTEQIGTYSPDYVYKYNPAVDFTRQFRYGGYSTTPDSYFGSITKEQR